MGWRERFAPAPLPGIADTDASEWEDVSPLVQRRRKADGSYEYRANPEAVAGAGKPALGADPDLPSAGNKGTGYRAIGENILSGMKGGVEFAAELPEIVATAARAGGIPAMPGLGLPDIVTPALAATRPGSLRPGGIVGAALEESREERERLADEAAARGAAAGQSPAMAALSYAIPQTIGNILDPTILIGGGEAAAAKLLRKSVPSWVKRFAPAAAKEIPAGMAELAERSLAIAPSRPGVAGALRIVEGEPLGRQRILKALGEDGRTVGELMYTRAPEGGFTVNSITSEGRDTGAGRALYREAAQREGPYRGSIARTAEGSGFVERLRQTDPDIFSGPELSFVDPADPGLRLLDRQEAVEYGPDWTDLDNWTDQPPPPPRIPLEDLPDPARFPLRDFEQISPLPPPVTAAVHRQGVERAVGAGERVRPAVLKDYPDLSAEVAVSSASPGERGHVKIPRGPGFLDRWFTKDGEFQALGELKGWAFERSLQKDREISAGAVKVKDTLRDFNTGMKEAVKETSLSPDEIFAYVEDGLTGGNDLSGIPPKLRGAVEDMRLHWDLASDEYVQRTDLPTALRDTIAANRGTYYPRHFRVHEDPEWARLVDPSSPAHDPKEAWRWNEYMDWAKAEREKAKTEPLTPGTLVHAADQQNYGKVVSFNPQTNTAMVHFVSPEGAQATVELPRDILTNLDSRIFGNMTDDELFAYGQHLLNKDPDAFVHSAGAIDREGRGNLRRRIYSYADVDDLPPELAAQVQSGAITLDGAVVQAKQIPGWWEDFVAHNPGMPPQLDNLLGLYKDPSLRYRTSMLRTVHDQAVYKLHRDLAEQGVNTIFFDTRQPGSFVRIGGKGPLAEKFASPEIAAVIRGSQSTAKAFSGWAAGLFEGWKKVRSGISIAKTHLNFPAGHIRNAAAWPFIHLAEGHFGAAGNPVRALKLVPYQIADKAGTQQGAIAAVAKRMADMVELADGTRLGERWSMDLKDLRPEIEFLHGQGVFGESAHGADLRHYEGVLGFGKASREGKLLTRAVGAGRALWEGGDDIGKHISFRANLQNLLWAQKDFGVAQSLPADYWMRAEWADQVAEAAKRTRLATPTRSMIAPGVKELRNLPAGPFPGWTAEQFRNAKENVRIALADLRDPNPKMKVLGAKRLGGFIASSALASSLRTGAKAGKWALLGGGIAGAVNLARGTEDDPGDALRSFVAPWSRDSQIVVTDVDKGGKVRSVDLSNLIPAAAFADGASALLRSVQDGNNYWDGFVDATKETLNPFFDEEIAISTLVDLRANKKGSSWFEEMMNQARTHPYKSPDYEVYDETGSRTRKAKQVLYHFWRQLGPAGVAGLQGERVLRATLQENQEVREAFADLTDYDRFLSVEDEAMSLTGLRFTTTDVGRSISRQGGDYWRQRIEISSDYARRKQPAGLAVASPERALELKAQANADGKRVHEMLVRSVADAMRLGYNQEQVRGWLKNGNVGAKHRGALIQDALRYLRGEPAQFYVPVVR